MTTARASSRAYPVDEFLQALGAQLDRAQDALSLKVSGTQRPLTWALKDLELELRVFVEITGDGKVTWRSASPGEEGASTVHLSFTTITRPMVEENSFRIQEDHDPRGIEQLTQVSELDENDQRKLSWMGVRTVGQLRKLDPVAVEAIAGIPISRLQAVLEAASRPAVTAQELVEKNGRTLLLIHGANLADGERPEVRLAGAPVEVLEFKPSRVLVRPAPHHTEGQIEVLTRGKRATGFFRMPEKEPPGHAYAQAIPAPRTVDTQSLQSAHSNGLNENGPHSKATSGTGAQP